MSEAACKTILCSGEATARVKEYLIKSRGESMDLDLAANSLLWELQQVVEITHLFAELGNEITRSAAYPLIHSMMQIETGLAGKNRSEATAFMSAMALEIHARIRDYHLAVTGEAIDY
jgi:hypothetical protein